MEYKNYKIIKSKEELMFVINSCKATGYASIDFETTGIEQQYEGGKPTILGISFQPGSAYIVPLAHDESPWKKSWEKVMKIISDNLLKDPDVVVIAYNLKFEHKWFFKYYQDMKGRLFDPMLMKYLLDEERPHDLKSLVGTLLPEFASYEDEVKTLSKQYGWAGIPIDKLSSYCALDCDLTLRLFILLEPKLIKNGFYALFRNLLMMVSRFYAEAEYNGMNIHREYLETVTEFYGEKIQSIFRKLQSHPRVLKYHKFQQREHIQKLIDKVNEEVEDLTTELRNTDDPKQINSIKRKIKLREEKASRYIAGDLKTKNERKAQEPVNFNSPKQLIELFFTCERGFNWEVTSYSDSGNPSTAEDALIEVKNKLEQEASKRTESGIKFLNLLLEYRGLIKLHSTYMKGMLERLTTEDKIHGTFFIHGTVTGRTSSRDPNLQNIPRSTTSNHVKAMFTPPPGYLVLEIDYSQAELRVVAELAKETKMIEYFKKGYNIHVATACDSVGMIDDYDEIKNVILKDENHPENLKWEKLKKRAKLINFGILYGQTAFNLAPTLECSPDEAQEFIDAWYNQYPKLAAHINKQKRYAEKHGYVKSLWGRKRRLPDAMEGNDPTMKGYYQKALRDAVNAPIQGASNDFTLFSQVIIREEQLKGNLPWDITFVASVHDALVSYIQPKDLAKCLPIMKEICNNPKTQEFFGFQMKYVDMKVSAEVGKTWGSKKDYDPSIDYEEWLTHEDYPHSDKYMSTVKLN